MRILTSRSLLKTSSLKAMSLSSKLIDFDNFSRRFVSQMSRPSPLSFLLLPLFLLKYGKSGFRFVTIMKVLRLKTFIRETQNNPELELLVLAHQKDSDMLQHVILGAVENSLNPINIIKIISPPESINQVQESLHQLTQRYSSIRFEYRTDIEVLGSILYTNLLTDFPKRLGWIAQQFLTVIAVLESKSAGVLQVDADTVDIQPTTWLLNDGRQVLHCSTEFHEPYYIVIKRLLGLRRTPMESHVPHQMVFQPELFRRHLSNLGIENVLDLYNRYIDISADFEFEDSRFCAKYELYAYLMAQYAPSKIMKLKFSNVAVPRKLFLQSPESFLAKYSKDYSSISTHSYLDKS